MLFMPALSVAQPLQDEEHGADLAVRGGERRSILLPELQLYRGYNCSFWTAVEISIFRSAALQRWPILTAQHAT